MIDTLHICGTFPLVVFVESNAIRLARAHRIVAATIDTQLYITFVEEHPSFGYETHGYEYDLSGLTCVVLRSSQTYVVFNRASFAQTAHLNVVGAGNTVEFWSCCMSNLYIDSYAKTELRFDQQPLLDSVSAHLQHTLVTGLKVRGAAMNSIDARDNSAVQLSVGLAKDCRRTFDFRKDNSSMISVVCSHRGSREVLEDRELWSITDGLEGIVNPRPAQEVS